MFLSGLDIAIVGWLAIALELVHGTGFDLYYPTRGYVSVPFYVGFAAVHLIAVVSGVALLRRGREVRVLRGEAHA